MTTEQILKLAYSFSRHTGLSMSTVGTYAAADGKFFGRLERGGGCTLRTAKKLFDWFAREWPADLEWPSDIPRPAPKTRGNAA